MEILQTIYNVLTTQNERLALIISSPLMFIESLLYMLIFLNVLKIEANKKQKTLYVLLYTTISLLNVFFIPSPYYTFINLIVFFLLVLLIFKTTILKSILSIVIVYVTTLFIGTPIILFCIHILKIPSNAVQVVPLYKIIYCILFYFFVYVVYLILKKFKFTFSIKILSNLKQKRLFYLNFVFGLLAIAIQCLVEFKYIDFIPVYLLLLSIFVLVLYFFISLYTLFRTSKLEITTKNLEEEKLYNQTLTVLYDKIRGFKHDFNNIVQGIGGYISTNNMEGLKEYYSQVLDDCQRVNNLALLSPDVINNPAIYSLITSKYHKAMEYGIKIDLEVFMDLTNINMKIYLLTRVLGILIDNAIEAAKDCDEKEIIITFRKDIQKNKQLFIIQNTYSNKDVNIDEIFEKGKTSKANNDSKSHGLGLWEIRQLLKKNHNLNLYTTKTEKYFKQQFEIYC